MRGRLNIRLAVALVAAFALGGGALVALQRYHQRRGAAGLLELARAAESDGKLDRAGRLVAEYLTRAPADTDARAWYARMVEPQARDAKSLQAVTAVYERVVADDPARADARRSLARLLARQGRYLDALPHLAALGAATAADAALAGLLAECHDALGDRAQAEAQYRRALELDPAAVGRSMRLAVLLRGGGPEGAAPADRVIDRMAEKNPADPAAWLGRARYRAAYRAGDAARDLAEAERLAPDNVEVRLAAAEISPPAEARRHLKHAIGRQPGDARLYYALAAAEERAGDRAAAADALKQGLARAPGSPQLLFAAAELAVGAGDAAAAERALGEVERWKLDPGRALVLRAQLRGSRGDWRGAKSLLEAGRASLTAAGADLAAAADVLAGRCHEALGEDDLALAAFRRAESLRADAAEGVARVLIKGGRLDEAVGYYRRLASTPNASPAAKLTYVQLRVSRHLASAAPGRTAGDIEPALAEAEAQLPGSADVLLLRVEVLAADGRTDDARKLLETALAARPGAPEFAVPLARLLSRKGDAAGAAAVLASAGGPTPPVEVLGAKLELLPRDAARTAEAEARLASCGVDEKLQLCVALAGAHSRWSDLAGVRRWWGEVVRLRPEAIGVRLQQFDLAMAAGDRGEMTATLGDIRKAEGDSGPVGHYLEALMLLTRPEDRTPAMLAEARRHLAAAALARPAWPRPATAQGTLSEMEGRADDALADYSRAVELGDRRPEVVQRVVGLLCERRRYAEAERVIQRAAPQGRLSPQLSRLAADMSLVNRETERAVELAGAAVPADSTEAEGHVWRASVLAVAGRGADAEAALRRATAVGGDRAGPWAALCQFYAKSGRPERVDTTIAEMSARLTGAALTLATAQCLDAAGRAPEAEAAYAKAVAERPADPAAVRELARFAERAGAPQRAVGPLRQFLAANPKPADAAWATRALAAGLAPGNYASFREGVSLLDRNLAADPLSGADALARARLLATRVAHRRDAIAQLQEMARRGPLSSDAEFLLGKLLADTGDWPGGRRLMVNVLSRDDRNPAGLAFFIDRLLKNGTPDAAESWLDRLDAAAPGDAQGLRLRAAWLARSGRATDAAELVAKSAPAAGKKPEDADRLRSLAGVAESAARDSGEAGAPLQALAERLLRRATESDRQADRLALAAYLGKRGQTEPALALVRPVGGEVTPAAVAATLLEIAYTTTPLTDAQLDAIEAELARRLASAGSGSEVSSIRGLFHARRGRYNDAATAFRSVVQAGGDAAAVNNLAYMLVLSGGPAEEVESLLAKAQVQVGETAELLDTRGTARLKAERVAEAVADLERAVDQEPTAARCVHLALAYRKAGRENDSARLRARAVGLRGDGSLVLPAEEKGVGKLGENEPH